MVVLVLTIQIIIQFFGLGNFDLRIQSVKILHFGFGFGLAKIRRKSSPIETDVLVTKKIQTKTHQTIWIF
jgi:hypothetical protein